MADGMFSGNTVTIYTQYLDLGNFGKTLVAHPSVTYNVTLADGWTASGLGLVPGDGNWALAPLLGGGTFTAIPGQAVPGLARPGWPGSVSMMGALPAETKSGDEAAGRAIFEDVRSRLVRMNEQVAVLRSGQRRPGLPSSSGPRGA